MAVSFRDSLLNGTNRKTLSREFIRMHHRYVNMDTRVVQVRDM